jgi:hypothetical protein
MQHSRKIAGWVKMLKSAVATKAHRTFADYLFPKETGGLSPVRQTFQSGIITKEDYTLIST